MPIAVFKFSDELIVSNTPEIPKPEVEPVEVKKPYVINALDIIKGAFSFPEIYVSVYLGHTNLVIKGKRTNKGLNTVLNMSGKGATTIYKDRVVPGKNIT